MPGCDALNHADELADGEGERAGRSEGMTSPVLCVVSDAASRNIPDASSTLKRAHASVVPISSVMASTKGLPAPPVGPLP